MWGSGALKVCLVKGSFIIIVITGDPKPYKIVGYDPFNQRVEPLKRQAFGSPGMIYGCRALEKRV